MPPCMAALGHGSERVAYVQQAAFQDWQRAKNEEIRAKKEEDREGDEVRKQAEVRRPQSR